MVEDAIPEDVRKLIADRITSVEQVEILLLLRSRPDVVFTPKMVSEEIRTSERSAMARLATLRDLGLLAAREGGFCFEPATEWLRRATDNLAVAYTERRYTIIDLIFSKPIENLRVYADAFRLRKDDSDG
jgi:hypothetical protein